MLKYPPPYELCRCQCYGLSGGLQLNNNKKKAFNSYEEEQAYLEMEPVKLGTPNYRTCLKAKNTTNITLNT
jgi:hypothetical protein